MGSLFRAILNFPFMQSALRPITRLVVGLIAIPAFRFIMRRIFRVNGLNHEFEKDIEQWFRGALLLLAATANMEHLLFGWLTRVDWLDRADWFTLGLRLMLAIGVIEAMPDQDIFAVIHPGPPALKPGRSVLKEIWSVRKAFVKGILCRHLNRSSPVLAMMCAIVGAQLPTAVTPDPVLMDQHQLLAWSSAQPISIDIPAVTLASQQLLSEISNDLMPQTLVNGLSEYTRYRERWLVGWVCYVLAVSQYLIIGLITSRDRAADVLQEFDRAVAQKRKELIDEFDLGDTEKSPPVQAD